jgi:putative transposase
MKAHRKEWSIQEMAKTLGISRSGYYRYTTAPLSKQRTENKILLSQIKQISQTSRQTYGSPRIHAELKAQGQACSRPRVARLMKAAGIQAKMKRRFKTTTRVNPAHAYAPNLLQQNFTAQKPNQTWVADISYIKTWQGWLYIAVVLDLFSRRVVGLSMGDSLHTLLVTQALEQALKRRGLHTAQGLCHHSDKGCQYTSDAFQRLLKEKGIVCSMSGKGNCFDNAAMESFFHTLKTECVYFENYPTREAAKQNIFEYIEVFYNHQRRHSTLGYVSPAFYEKCHFEQQNFPAS